ncbi:MAG TPA: helix-turn-helix domain-containing protein [Pyrinomonadaceae bacterium]|nr:helix-turn-helix domain-containing protein [Pyrinomonadaceae bacterium]
MRRRKGDGCPVTGALQLVGDRWTLLVARELVRGARRTTDLLASLHPISSRTLLGRLRDMERDALVERRNRGGSPPCVEYNLTGRGRLLVPVLDALRELGGALGCDACDERRQGSLGDFCGVCPRGHAHAQTDAPHARTPARDDSIVLL